MGSVVFLVIQLSRKIDWTRDNFRLFMLLKMYFAMTVYLQNTRKEPSCLAELYASNWASFERRLKLMRRSTDVVSVWRRRIKFLDEFNSSDEFNSFCTSQYPRILLNGKLWIKFGLMIARRIEQEKLSLIDDKIHENLRFRCSDEMIEKEKLSNNV